MDEILVKYLLNEASEKEVQVVRSWMEQSADNKKYYEHFRLIWDESKKVELASTINENDAWEKFKTGLQNGSFQKPAHLPETIALKPRRIFSRLAVAATVLLTIGIAAYFYSISGTTIASGDKVLVKTLPDNSVITLNKNSEISYKKSFNKTDRHLALSGEAFFNVTPNKQKPFEIEVDNIKVTVVGTSFNINEDKKGTEVIVETGVVTVQLKDKIIKLLPGQKTFISKGSQELLVQPNHNKLYNYYRTNKFICNNTPLSELVEILNKSYNANIKILNPEIANLRLTTQFNKESLDEILNIISETLDLKIEHEKNGDINIR
jgi:ferric-dicitrate binding protein FerR (iron transport regulator)